MNNTKTTEYGRHQWVGCEGSRGAHKSGESCGFSDCYCQDDLQHHGLWDASINVMSHARGTAGPGREAALRLASVSISVWYTHGDAVSKARTLTELKVRLAKVLKRFEAELEEDT